MHFGSAIGETLRALVPTESVRSWRAGEAVYGLPELYAEALPVARLVANPGCYATSVILGLRPLWRQAGSICRAGLSATANRA